MIRFSKYAVLLIGFLFSLSTLQAQINSARGKDRLNKEIKRDPAIRLHLWDSIKPQESSIPDESYRNTYSFSEGQIDENEDVIQSTAISANTKDDYYASKAYDLFSLMHFRVRAYESTYQNVYVNGVTLNDAERGNFSHEIIGGLNDVTHKREAATYIGKNSFGHGSLLNAININMRAGQYTAGHKASLVGCNRNYLAHAMYTYSTGVMNNGWAVTASASYRWANEGVIDGTSYNSLGYFIALEKKINSKHSISFATWGSPTERALQGAATEEAYQLADSHYYNPYWGYRNGEKHNARIVTSFEPITLFTWDWQIDRNTKLTTSVAGKYSRYGTSALGWNSNATDPRPNHYHNTNRQIDWDYMYAANEQANALGEEALYYVEKRNNDRIMLNLGSVLNHEFDKNNHITLGVNLGTTRGMHYKTLDDLLGSNSYGTDVDNPNRIIKEGDKFGYDYDIYVNTMRMFAQHSYTDRNIELHLGAHIDRTSIERYGNMCNGRVVNNSKGSSGTENFLGCGSKLGIRWNINDKHTIIFGGGCEQRAPLAYNAFIAPRMRNEFVHGLENEKIINGEVKYRLTYGSLMVQLAAYYTRFNDVVEHSAFYNDMLSDFTYLSMTGIDKVHSGIEVAVVYNVTSSLSFNIIGSLNRAEYINNANGFLINENENIVQSDKVYMDGVKVDGTPLTALSIGSDYNTNGWHLSVAAKYFDNIYIGASSYRRMASMAGVYATDSKGSTELGITSQYKGKAGWMIDTSIGKDINLRGGQRLNINLQLQNVLNNENMITGGYEQNYSTYLYYANAFNFYLNIGLRF